MTKILRQNSKKNSRNTFIVKNRFGFYKLFILCLPPFLGTQERHIWKGVRGGGCEGADHGNLQKFPHIKINTFSVLSRPLTLVLHFRFLPTHLPYVLLKEEKEPMHFSLFIYCAVLSFSSYSSTLFLSPPPTTSSSYTTYGIAESKT
jgi:hypothetical protein